MRYDWLLEPVSEAEPCGLDLDEAGDDEYLNYVLSVTGRIPERYFRKEDGKPIERNEIKLKDEVEAIDGLLARTRDIRLLCVEVRLQSFVGEFSGFADCLDAMAGLVERFWADVHPQAAEGDFTLRQNVLSALDDWWQVIQPLQQTALVRDKRLGPIVYRHAAIAQGSVQKRADENVPDMNDVLRTIASEENRAMSDLTFAAAVRASAALARLRKAFIENSGYDYVPSFDRLSAFLDQVVALFRTSRPELAQAGPETPGPEEEDGGEAADGPASPAAPEPKAAPARGLIANHADATAALLAVETYFASWEPSAPALLLVHQARTLVGKPLIHTLEVLLPEAAAKALIRIKGDINLQLNMAHLKQLTEGVPGLAEATGEAGAPTNSFAADTRAEALTLMAEVELFFKTVEPSSPIPILLARAGGFSNRDFNAILKDLLSPN